MDSLRWPSYPPLLSQHRGLKTPIDMVEDLAFFWCLDDPSATWILLGKDTTGVHGFRTQLSTSHQLLRVVEYVKETRIIKFTEAFFWTSRKPSTVCLAYGLASPGSVQGVLPN
ncbi:hypothetical protein TNIN_114671 [Trichonephila inaurata madagascariensis]|uniref:Uncharacterized protein n=1 Tax=Trichonephila inaurata madagascariensis TaxID=2747483 RepID=A0A8X6XHZ1_9ARAC|nr:hypothetical protein TNIN_114671 [Trichonephila inaurata madagascariensis]